jgi:hypothetical protein
MVTRTASFANSTSKRAAPFFYIHPMPCASRTCRDPNFRANFLCGISYLDECWGVSPSQLRNLALLRGTSLNCLIIGSGHAAIRARAAIR